MNDAAKRAEVGAGVMRTAKKVAKDWQGLKADGCDGKGEMKPRWDLLPHDALGSVVAVLTHGAKKYEPNNWRRVKGWRWRYYRAALGHLAAWWTGEMLDRESKLPHLAHAICCALFMLELDLGIAHVGPCASEEDEP